ncbi:enoyl-CoA hydratase/isomerase family protein [Aliidongia dinghuensis]|nr:enoyl-CoA hydratase-related protein [Aliidongia dinghuensis]
MTRDGAVAWLRFNRPAVLNAVDEAMAVGFRDGCRAVAEDGGFRVLVLAGNGRSFMAGGDLGRFHAAPERAPETAGAIISALHEGLTILDTLAIPVIVSVQGPVAGAGFSVVTAADLCIAADNASFTLAYARIGATLDGSASYNLPRLIGQRRALELALLADTIDAPTALGYGIVNRVVPLEALEVETRRLAERLAAGPTAALGRIRRLIRESWEHNLEDQLALEKANFRAAAATEDFREGIAAFAAKRRPAFSGR